MIHSTPSLAGFKNKLNIKSVSLRIRSKTQAKGVSSHTQMVWWFCFSDFIGLKLLLPAWLIN
jgi:hypothetical protein